MLNLVPQSSASSDLLEGLNDAQRTAVVHTEGPLLIIAGAGSGKTRVLTLRVAYLIRAGVHPSHILALTFTNKAAQEMKERIAHLVGDGTGTRMWAGTFHSIFARILRAEAEQIGYTSGFTIYDADDSLAAIKAVMNAMGISQQVMPPQGVRSRISSAKNAMVSYQEYVRKADSIQEKQTGQIYEEYEKRLTQSNAMDFDDLLLNTIRLFERHDEVLQKYQQRFRYLLVDEYQDTNRAQYIAVSMLAKAYRNLCVVGDDAQSIYRWRGADIRNILDFQKDYAEAVVVRLEQNYRSTKTILSAADGVIKNNRKQLVKTLWTDNPEGEKITLLACRDDREEADAIVRTLRERITRSNYTYKDAAVLYRTNAQSQSLEDALRRSNLPYHIVSGVSFYKRKEVKDTLSYLRLLVNPADSESVMRVINEPTRGIGATSLQRIAEWAQQRNVAMFDALREVGMIPNVQKRTVTAVLEFVDLIDRHRALLEELSPSSLAQSYIEATGMMQQYKQLDTEESRDRWNNIDRVLSHIAETQEHDETLTLATYIEQIALLSDADDPQLGNNRVALMTMHAAKGLEFPLVVIAGLEQGLFPLAKAELDMNEQEEERRLFYVGITRARQQLVLAYAERRYRFGELVFNRPSMFLSEIDKSLFDEKSQKGSRAVEPMRASHGMDQRPESMAPARKSYAERGGAARGYSAIPPPSAGPAGRPKESYSQAPANESYSQEPTSSSGLRVGMRVKHPMFGVGTVAGLSGSGQQAKATVQFVNGGRKQLMVAFAKLEVI